MNTLQKNPATSIGTKITEYRDEYRINITSLLNDDRFGLISEKIINLLADGKGRLEIGNGIVSLYFLDLLDRENFRTWIHSSH